MHRTLVVVGLAALVACGSSAAHRTKPTDAAAAADARGRAFVAARGEAIHAIARDDGYLYWADGNGVHRRPLGGPRAGDARLLTRETAAWADVPAMIVAGGTVWLSNGIGVYTLPAAGGKLTTIVEDLGGVLAAPFVITALARAGDGVVAATADGLARVPAHGAPTRLVDGQVHVYDTIADDTHVYWTDYGEDPSTTFGLPPVDPGAPGAGAVRRIPLAGGAIEELATGEHGPAGLAIAKDRLWWTSARGDGLRSVPLGGGDRRDDVPGQLDRVVIDETGIVVRTTSSVVVEPRGRAPAIVRMVPDGTYTPAPEAPVVTADWIYVHAFRPTDPSSAVIAVPRDRGSVELIASAREQLFRVRAHAGAVIWVEQHRDGSGMSIYRRDPSTGRVRRLTRRPGWLTDLAIGGSDLYFAEDQAIWRLAGDGTEPVRFGQAQTWVSALTVHRSHVYWLDGASLVAKRRKGGKQFTLASTAGGYAGDVGIDLVFDDDYVYTTSFGGGSLGVYRISERGAVTLLWDGARSNAYPGRDLVRVADELFFWANGIVYRLPLDGSAASPLWHARSESYVADLVEGGGYLYVMLPLLDKTEVVRIDPATGEGKAVLRWQGYAGDQGLLAADDRAVYVGNEVFDGILRIPHDAPAVPDPGWPAR